MEYQNIVTEKRDGVLIITINREAKLNALTIATLQEIKHAVNCGQSDPDIHGMILTGSGPKAFAAGADISEFANFNNDEGTRMSADGHEVMNSIEEGSKVVIAAVNGFALGGGCELAMACHMRVASTNAKFGQPEVNLGVPPGYGGTQRLIQLVGKGKAIELLVTGDAIDAQTALQLGLVNYVVEQEQLLDKAMEILAKVQPKSPSAEHKVLKCVNDYFQPNVNGMQREIYEFGEAFESDDFKEGTTAFMEKRKAEFERKSTYRCY